MVVVDTLRRSSGEIGTIQMILACRLRKDDTHTTRRAHCSWRPMVVAEFSAGAACCIWCATLGGGDGCFAMSLRFCPRGLCGVIIRRVTLDGERRQHAARVDHRRLLARDRCSGLPVLGCRAPLAATAAAIPWRRIGAGCSAGSFQCRGAAHKRRALTSERAPIDRSHDTGVGLAPCTSAAYCGSLARVIRHHAGEAQPLAGARPGWMS